MGQDKKTIGASSTPTNNVMDGLMKIALIGYGKMGKLIEQAAKMAGHSICSIFSRNDPIEFKAGGLPDVCIDFSRAESVLKHVKQCIEHKTPLIIGTTGWEDNLGEVQRLVESSSIGCLYSPNFSVGVALFTQIVSQAAKLMSSLTEYDVSGVEYHHKLKADSPSGTAKALSRHVEKEMGRIESLHFSSIRSGYIPGTHTIHFDGPVDSITLTHTARNREGFALGAIKAAEWIIGKKGFFTMEDLLENQEHLF
jgi:4-hydroxy-tetrahydrodipicolinate reductase